MSLIRNCLHHRFTNTTGTVALSLFLLAAGSNARLVAQTSDTSPVTVPGNTPAVPNLIKYNGTLVDGRGYPITVPIDATFSLYEQATAALGEPQKALWKETQHITPNEKGAYTVYLGSATPLGLPIEVFTSVMAQYLGVKVEGESEMPRTLLVSVPYAFKAGDAQTLGGLPASAYALAGSLGAATGSAAPTGNTADVTVNVTTPGGTSGYLPMFTGTAGIADSIVFENSLGIGIGDVPNGALDVNGKSIFRGPLQVARIGNATTAEGVNSNPFSFFAQAYDSSTKGNVGPFFSLQAEPTGNNTSSPGATLNLLYNNGLTANSETGLHFNTNGTIHFAPGQTFPGGNITSVGLSAPSSDFSVSGSPVTGAGTLGLNWKVAPTSADNANAIVKRDAGGGFAAGVITANLGMAGITSASASAGVTGINNGGGNAVSGVSLQASGVGLYGDGAGYGVESVGGAYGAYATGGYIGVWGESTSTTSANGDGVHGVTASGLASGVAGVNNAGGVGVYGTGGTGVFGTGSSYGMVTDSNVQQARTAGGWVKAMVEVDATSSINRCFNSTLAGAAATTPPCGIDLEHPESGVYNFNFNFEVDDRFYSTQILNDSTLALAIYRGTNLLQVLSYDGVSDLEDGEFQLIVY